MRLRLIYEDNHQTDVMIARDEMFNTYRYVNISDNHICRCQFPNMTMAIKDLLNYPEITSVIEINTNQIYSVEAFVSYFYKGEDV